MKNKKPKWLIEKYTDKYRTLYQAIMIDLDRDKKSNGKESSLARQCINPNLNILLYKEYYNEKMELLEKEEIINDNWYFEE